MTTPAYQRLADALRTAILNGTYQPGDTLPKLTDLMAQHGVSKTTASEAFRTLEREGLVEVVRRRGTVVLDPAVPRPLLRTREVLRDEIGYYFDPQAQPWRALQPPTRAWAVPPRDIAVLLGVPAGEEVLWRDRVMGDPDTGTAMQLATSFLPAAVARSTVLEEADTGPGGIYDRLEEMGHGPLEWSETITARMPTPGEAEVLGVPRGIPLLRVLRTAVSPAGLVVEINDTRMSAARFAIGYPLTRHESARSRQ
ncbi:GntR family transcriptional regulator [Streptacidiphilus sp. EB129]|uniref:GntR family transcriptional regulator n=1 Tax=Streptacidiphilus sp. EB129 TaxID=3156262 RepID=UPI00351547B1